MKSEKVEEMNEQQCFSKLYETLIFAKGQYFTWASALITLSSAILSFVVKDLFVSGYIKNKILGIIGFGCFLIVIIYGLYGLKSRIENEINSTQGNINEIVDMPISNLQKKALAKNMTQAVDRFSDILFGFLLIGICLIIISLIPC